MDCLAETLTTRLEAASGAAEPSRKIDYREDKGVKGLTECGKEVPADLWQGLVTRGCEVAPLLSALIDEAELFVLEYDQGDDDAESHLWGICHAAFIAAEIGDPASAASLIALGATDDENEWLAEGFAWFPCAFGPETADLFLDFVLDETVSWFPRSSCAKGMVWAAGRFPELREGVASAFAGAIDSQEYDSEMITWLVRPGIRTGDERVVAAIERAFAREATGTLELGDQESLLLREPRDWYLTDPPSHLTAESYLAALQPRRARRGSARVGAPRGRPGKATTKKQQRQARKKSRRKGKKKRR